LLFEDPWPNINPISALTATAPTTKQWKPQSTSSFP
jgi:hypothetical protein